jgi:uncharacterized membrane protein
MQSTALEVFHAALGLAATTLEAASTITILAGAGLALFVLARRRGITQARHALSNAILLALDFAIGADIIKVASDPEMSTVFLVGGVVAIRIALTFVIVWELRHGPLLATVGEVSAS